MKKRRRLRWLVVILIVLVLLITVECIWSNTALTVRNYTLRSEKIVNPMRIVLLTDLHGLEFGDDNEKLLSLIADQKPDLIALVGDIFNNDADDAEIARMCSFIRNATAIAPVYFGLGNHEAAFIQSHRIDLVQKITEAGASILESTFLDLEIRGNSIRIGGYMGYYRQPGMMTTNLAQMELERAFAAEFESADAFKLLLNHIPTSWLDWRYMDQYPVDLVLSGHYHGGVVRIPLLEQGLYAPYVGWFPPYTTGLFQGKQANCILTTGLAGYSWVPRYFNQPEIAVVELLPNRAA